MTDNTSRSFHILQLGKWLPLALAIAAYPWAFIVKESVPRNLPVFVKLCAFFLPAAAALSFPLVKIARIRSGRAADLLAIALAALWLIWVFTLTPSPIPLR